MFSPIVIRLYVSITEKQMEKLYDADHVSLHVRETNTAAFHLYNKTLNYQYDLLGTIRNCTI